MTPAVSKVVERVKGLVELVTNLDRRMNAALDSLEEMRRMELLPDFMSRRLKGEGRRKPPTPTSEQPNV